MGIADTIKGWFSSGKSTGGTHGSQISDTVQKGMHEHEDQLQPGMNKLDDGIDATGRKMEDMTGGKGSGLIDKGTDTAEDTINKMGKQNP